MKLVDVLALTFVLTGASCQNQRVSPSSPATGVDSTYQTNGLHALTQVDVANKQGYFQDPHPVYPRANTAARAIPTFTGTTRKIIACTGHFQPGCLTFSPMAINADEFTRQANSAGLVVNNLLNLNAYQSTNGEWHMVLVAHVKRDVTVAWNLIVHASPIMGSGTMPTAWTVDKILIGDLQKPANDTYDPKYFEDQGTLYLIYNKQLRPGIDAIVAQEMTSPTTLAPSNPVPLFSGEPLTGGYESEVDRREGDVPIKITEAANVTKIAGKYVLTYSVGSFNKPNYKIGVVYSDTFIPQNGHGYTRPLIRDETGVWGHTNRLEIPYLLQADQPRWPNYVGGTVVSPGVGSIVMDEAGAYYLVFAAYDPADSGLNPTTNTYDGSHRRPYVVPLTVQIPGMASVVQTDPQALATWIKPRL